MTKKDNADKIKKLEESIEKSKQIILNVILASICVVTIYGIESETTGIINNKTCANLLCFSNHFSIMFFSPFLYT